MSDGMVVFIVVVGGAALFLDALIPDRKGAWKGGPASAQDVARIVGGAKPPASERVVAKFGLLLVVVGVLWTMLG